MNGSLTRPFILDMLVCIAIMLLISDTTSLTNRFSSDLILPSLFWINNCILYLTSSYLVKLNINDQ